MKMFKNIKLGYAILLGSVLLTSSCKKILEENPRSDVTPDAFSTPAGLLGGISGVYNALRGAWGTEGFTINQMAGTDEHMMGGSAQNQRVFTYNGLTSTDFNGGFGLYTSINALNGILEKGPSTPGLDAATLKMYLGQAQFLRAYIYFYLIQTYGNIPLRATFVTEPSQAAEPAPANDIYNLIVADLTAAITNLPNTPTAPFLGKAATVGAAKWLLAKAYLTRGWLNSSNADFQLAYTTALDLITNKATYGLDLWQNYADAFNPANDYGKETIFVTDHTNDPKYGFLTTGSGQAGGAGINVTPWMGLFNAPAVVGVNSTKNASGALASSGPTMINRDVQFGRPFTRIRPNMPLLASGPNSGKSYILDQAFVNRPVDSRYDKTFQTVWLANCGTGGGGNQMVVGVYSGPSVTGSRGQLTAGLDTAIWFPDNEVVGAPQNNNGNPFKGIIVTPALQNNNVFPYMKKLADPRRLHHNDPSYRPVVHARFSEVYLIAAEAAFKLGQLQNAADMINVVRKRAAYRTGAANGTGCAAGSPTCYPSTSSGDLYAPGFNQATAEAAMTITSGQVTLDFILDERSREFYGESVRWLDLVRTKSLVTRVKAWNPTEAGTNIKPEYMLRPIPQDQIDRVVSGPKYPQNPGY
ncbi:MAG: RagB/SusD family nutrient uptake outer membrane protein [Chitinophagaceae bacterium]